MSLYNTLEDLIKLSSIFGAGTKLCARSTESGCPPVKLTEDSVLDRWDCFLLYPVFNKPYYLCSYNEAAGKYELVSQLFVPFDKEHAPLTNNLLVYSNGEILWDNVRLAQRAKGIA